MKKMRTHFTNTTEGKIFCAFIALIIVSELGVKLRKFMKKKGIKENHRIEE
jgi:hypothetical protein